MVSQEVIRDIASTASGISGLIMIELAMIIFRSGFLAVYCMGSSIYEMITERTIESWKILWLVKHSFLLALCICLMKWVLSLP